MNTDTLMAAAALVTSLGLGGGGLWAALANRPKMSAEARASNAAGEATISGAAVDWAEKFEAQADKALARAERAEQRARDAEDRADAADERAQASEDRLDAIENTLNQVVHHVGVLNDQIVELGGHPTPPPSSLIPPLTHPDPRPTS